MLVLSPIYSFMLSALTLTYTFTIDINKSCLRWWSNSTKSIRRPTDFSRFIAFFLTPEVWLVGFIPLIFCSSSHLEWFTETFPSFHRLWDRLFYSCSRIISVLFYFTLVQFCLLIGSNKSKENLSVLFLSCLHNLSLKKKLHRLFGLLF